jgi:Fic family protein
MRESDFTEDSPGKLVSNANSVKCFVPHALLTTGMSWLSDLGLEVTEAMLAVGRLDGALRVDTGVRSDLILRPLLSREATLSSRIEGTVSTERAVAEFELSGKAKPGSDVREVANYLAALQVGAAYVREKGLTQELITTLHRQLLIGTGREVLTPGEYRVRQVFIGVPGDSIHNARFVPPPPELVPGLISDLVTFLDDGRAVPPVVRVALAHYFFEATHPFLDGNGRVGRLLMTLQMMHDAQMTQPALHLSPYFERNKDQYYDRLLGVSLRGDWPGWVRFVLIGIKTQSAEVLLRMQRLLKLRREYRARFDGQRGAGQLFQLIDLAFEHLALDAPGTTRRLSVSKPTAGRYLRLLVEAGILKESTGRERDRIYIAEGILSIARENLAESEQPSPPPPPPARDDLPTVT